MTHLQVMLFILPMVLFHMGMARASSDAPTHVNGLAGGYDYTKQASMPSCILYQRKCCTKIDPLSCSIEFRANFPCSGNLSDAKTPTKLQGAMIPSSRTTLADQSPQQDVSTSGSESAISATQQASSASMQGSTSAVMPQSGVSEKSGSATPNPAQTNVNIAIPGGNHSASTVDKSSAYNNTFTSVSQGLYDASSSSNITSAATNATAVVSSKSAKAQKAPCPKKSATNATITTSGIVNATTLSNDTTTLTQSLSNCTKCSKKHSKEIYAEKIPSIVTTSNAVNFTTANTTQSSQATNSSTGTNAGISKAKFAEVVPVSLYGQPKDAFKDKAMEDKKAISPEKPQESGALVPEDKKPSTPETSRDKKENTLSENK